MGGPYGTKCSRSTTPFFVRPRRRPPGKSPNHVLCSPPCLGKERENPFFAKAKGNSRPAASGVPAFRGVDALVRNINSAIGGAGNAYDSGEGTLVAEDGRTVEEGTATTSSSSLLDTTGYKHIGMRIRLGDRVTIEETVDDAERFSSFHRHPRKSVTKSLQSYLGLPLDQYSLLNPKWITRLEGDEEGTFVLKIPLNEIVGLQFQPSMKAQVEMDTDGSKPLGMPLRRRHRESQQPQNSVTVIGKETKMGSHIFDDLVNISFQLNLQEELPRNNSLRRRREERSENAEDVRLMEQNSETTLKGQLVLDVEVNVPMPLSKLPKRVLKSAGGTLIRLVMKRMLKGFLVLLVQDFERWCYGDYRTAIDAPAPKEEDEN